MEPLKISKDGKEIGHTPIIDTFHNDTHPTVRKIDPLVCTHEILARNDATSELCMKCLKVFDSRPSWSNRNDGYPTESERGRIAFRQLLEQRHPEPAPITIDDIVKVQEQLAWEYMISPGPLTWGIVGKRVSKFMLFVAMFASIGLMVTLG